MVIKNLDPKYEKATERLNRFFREEHEDIREFTKDEMLYYLSTVLLWYELEIKRRRQRDG